MPIITISREAGSHGDELAERLALRTGYRIIDFDTMIDMFLKPIASEHEKKMLERSTKYFFEPINKDERTNFKAYLEGALHEYADNNDAIFLNGTTSIFLQNHPRAIHLRTVAPKKIRSERIKEAQSLYRVYLEYQEQDKEFHRTTISLRELMFLEKFFPTSTILSLSAEGLLQRIERQYRKLALTLFNADISDSLYYHLVLNTEKLTLDHCMNLIDSLIDDFYIQKHLDKQGNSAAEMTQNSDLPEFKNESELEFVHLLNLYDIEWRYEPKSFPVEWDEQNQVTMAFSPDFYLPKFDLYLELTTMNQKYVSAKKKKLEKLKELYPDVNVKIIYKRDFLSLIQRFD
ncbi:MAG: cytidylate kinase-like family protein [Clostridiaceae bacterium]|nr:cytidylate kinase-like family protein [Clostridiaceae bacterium]